MGERRESKRSVQSTISHPNARANNEQDEKSKLTRCKGWGNDEKANVPSSQQSRIHTRRDEKSKLTGCKGWGNDQKANVPSSQQSGIQTHVQTTNKMRNRNSRAARDRGTTIKQTFRTVTNLAPKRTCTQRTR